jgi:Zn ribbon nucleic-acid-binding protein
MYIQMSESKYYLGYYPQVCADLRSNPNVETLLQKVIEARRIAGSACSQCGHAQDMYQRHLRTEAKAIELLQRCVEEMIKDERDYNQQLVEEHRKHEDAIIDQRMPETGEIFSK